MSAKVRAASGCRREHAPGIEVGYQTEPQTPQRCESLVSASISPSQEAYKIHRWQIVLLHGQLCANGINRKIVIKPSIPIPKQVYLQSGSPYKPWSYCVIGSPPMLPRWHLAVQGDAGTHKAHALRIKDRLTARGDCVCLCHVSLWLPHMSYFPILWPKSSVHLPQLRTIPLAGLWHCPKYGKPKAGLERRRRSPWWLSFVDLVPWHVPCKVSE